MAIALFFLLALLVGAGLMVGGLASIQAFMMACIVGLLMVVWQIGTLIRRLDRLARDVDAKPGS